jgi:hypothetical protein
LPVPASREKADSASTPYPIARAGAGSPASTAYFSNSIGTTDPVMTYSSTGTCVLERGKTMKRLAISTFMGLVAGGICGTLLFSFHIVRFTAVALIWVLLNRAVMGFAIGVSRLPLHWAWNGIVMGMVVGSIFSYFLFMTLGAGSLPAVNFFVNGLFGLLIEFFTSVVFKQPAFPAVAPARRAAAA